MLKCWLSLNTLPKLGEQISKTIAAPADYIGLERFAARKKLVEQAEAEGWLDQIQPYDSESTTR